MRVAAVLTELSLKARFLKMTGLHDVKYRSNQSLALLNNVLLT